MLESCNLWHGRLGHVNYDILQRLINLELLPKFGFDSNNNCEVCVESKFIRTPFQSFEGDTEPKIVKTGPARLVQQEKLGTRHAPLNRP